METKNQNGSRKTNPVADANIFSKITFWWLKDFIGYGSKNDVKKDDLFDIFAADKTEKLGDDLEKAWFEECKYARENKLKPNFFKCAVKLYGKEYLKYAMFFILMGILQMIQPLTLKMIIPYFDTPPKASGLQAYLCATASVLLLLMTSTFRRYGFFKLNCLGIHIKIACSSLIYRKVLRLPTSLKNSSASESMINLLSNDVIRFELMCCSLPFLIIIPMQTIFMLYLMSRYIGIAAASLAIFLLMLQSLPIQAIYFRVTTTLRAKQAAKTDKRVSLISEILSAIRIIKMYAWEKFFESAVFLLRKNEIRNHLQISYATSVALATVHFVHRWSIYFFVLTCIFQNNILTSAQIIPVMQYLSTLRDNVTVYFSGAIKSFADTAASVKRIEAFLIEKENESRVETTSDISSDKNIKIRAVTASWDCQNCHEVLKDINLEVDSRKLLIVVGPIGCGKSSLLKLILGELPAKTGDISVCGTVSYASQEPWLFSGSIRDNILFGNKYDELKYKHVIEACALVEDFDQLPYEDKTLVGEKGMSLSGGQCARINLARAVYRDADIYLLDNPLSSVDGQVAKKLFDECIDGLLKDKTRIVVTHSLTYINRAHSVLLMSDGVIEYQGSPTELKSSEFTLPDSSSDEIRKADIQTSNVIMENAIDIKEPLVGNDNINNEPEETEEFLAKGSISGSLIPNYIKASKSYFLFYFWIFSTFIIVLQCAGFDYWIVIWTQQREILLRNTTDLKNNSIFNITKSFNIYDNESFSIIFGSLVMIITIISILKNLAFFKFMLNASKNIHDNMFATIMKAPLKFFETNPSGRIMNRFTEDIGVADDTLTAYVIPGSDNLIETLAFLLPVLIINWYHSISMTIIGILVYKVYSLCAPTLRGVMRLETIAKSPVLSFAITSSLGKETIRSHKAEKIVDRGFNSRQDEHTAAYLMRIAVDYAFASYLDLLTVVLFVLIVYISLIFKSSSASAGDVGLVLLQTSNISFFISATVRYLIFGTYGYLVNLERMFQITELEPEESPEGSALAVPKSWPNKGEIKFVDLCLKYSDEDQPILKNLNIAIKSQEKVGVVGRTGAGKSSLISALFRLTKIDGAILIDDIDTKGISLKELRSKLSIIPQEPILFSASLRSNLDPFNEFEDATLWAAIESAELKKIFPSLDHVIEKGGCNLSVGQRQLVCLARAIIKNNKILVLDEATANVDLETDALIQKTLRAKFNNCTVITVAHRLNTVMDSDKILVMDNGKIVEYDHPKVLLKNSNGYFYKMAKQANILPELSLKNGDDTASSSTS